LKEGTQAWRSVGCSFRFRKLWWLEEAIDP
jgi:hypothetical protein